MERTNEIEEAASDWLVRRESGQWTPAEQARFEQWLDASTLNRVAFLRLELAWEESARLQALGAGMPGDQPPPPGQWNLSPFFDSQRGTGEIPGTAAQAPPRRTHRFAVAASVLLVIAAVGMYSFWTGDTNRYRTPVGGLSSVPISDGSKVTLNTASEIRIWVNEKERRIDLRQGEAFFDVAKDPQRPFVVVAGNRRVVAVGTKFSVRRDGEAIEVVVTEGKVRLEDANRARSSTAEASGSATAPQRAKDPVLLTTGTIGHADESGVLVQRKSLPEAERRLSWRSGVLMFREQTLADAVAEFNRYNERKVVITDPVVAGLKIEGNFRTTNVDAFVRLLESGFPVHATTEDGRIVLSSR